MSFSGARFNMRVGEIREVEETETVRELLRIGYLEDVGAEEQTEVQPNENKRGKPKHNQGALRRFRGRQRRASARLGRRGEEVHNGLHGAYCRTG